MRSSPSAKPESTPPSRGLAERRGLQLRPGRPGRAMVGGLIVATCAVTSVMLLAQRSERHEVLALNREVQADEVITLEMLDTITIGSDEPIATIRAADVEQVVGTYARYRLAPTLLTWDALQQRPVVTDGRVLVAVVVPASRVPPRLGPEEDLVLVVVPRGDCARPATVDAVLVAPIGSTGPDVAPDDVDQFVSLSLEIEPQWLALVSTGQVASVVQPPLDGTVVSDNMPSTASTMPCPVDAAPAPGAQAPVTTLPPSQGPLRPTTTTTLPG